MATIGFVGLGHMGLPMATNLVKMGHQVTGYDLQESCKSQFRQMGGLIAGSIHEVAKEKEVLITMLQTGQQVLQVCHGPKGLFQNARHHTLFIDCSTIDVSSSKNIHQLAKANHLFVVDAPVSGGMAGAAAGTLTFMVGGDDQDFTMAKPILSAMGSRIIHTGEAGSGQAAKICNNMILGISMIAVSEALTLGEKLGISPHKLFEVVSHSSGQCWSMTSYIPIAGILDNVPANHDYKPGFAAAMMLKDLLLSQDAAHSAKINTPLGAQSTALYQKFINEGFGDLDFSAIIKLIAQDHKAS